MKAEANPKTPKLVWCKQAMKPRVASTNKKDPGKTLKIMDFEMKDLKRNPTTLSRITLLLDTSYWKNNAKIAPCVREGY